MNFWDSKAVRWSVFALAILWIAANIHTFFTIGPGGEKGFNLDRAFETIGLIFRHVIFHYAMVLLIFLSAWVAGRRISRLIKLEFTGLLEETLICLPLGIAAVSMAVMLLGFLHLLYVPVMWLLAIAPIVIWRKQFADDLKRAGDASRRTKISAVQVVLLLTLMILILLVCLNPLYPPTSLDAVNAYLTMAKRYLDTGWFVLDPYIKYSMTPNNHTLMFTQAMGMGSAETAVLTHFGVWILLLSAIAGFGARYLSPNGGLAAAIAFALIPVTTVTATWGNAENFVALFALMSFWGMWRFVKSRSSADAILTGIFLGFGVGVKIFLGMLWIWLLVAGAIYLVARKVKFPVKGFVIVVLVSGAIVLPWFIRNIVYFGNPMFPYMNNVFSMGGIYAEYEEDLQSDTKAGLKGFSPEANNVTLMELPKEMTFWPSWGSKPGAQERQQMRFTERPILGIGPLFLAFIPLLLFVRRRWDVLAGLLIISALCIFTWFYGLEIIYIRYWSFFFPLLMLAGGFAFSEALGLDNLSIRKPAGLVFMGLLSLLCILHFLNFVMPRPGGGELPLKDISREQHIMGSVMGYSFINELNQMSPEPRVYFLYGATSRYYCDFFLIAGHTSPNNYARFWENASTAESLAEWLRSIDITHLLVNEDQVRKSGKSLPGGPGFDANFQLLKRSGTVSMYELNPG